MGLKATAAQTFAVVIPYFNPVGYGSHTQKLAETLEAFRRAGIAEHVYLSGAGKRPAVAANVVHWDEHCEFLWHKERLINLAAAQLAGRYSHIAWVDSDVIVGADWPSAMAEAFSRAQVVQCFRTAHYRMPDGPVSRTRVSVIADGTGGNGAMGLAWGAERSFFTHGPGLFDLGLVGGGDSVFGLGVLGHTDTSSVTWLPGYRAQLGRAWSPCLLDALDGWLGRARDWHGGASAVAAEAEVDIIEHGSVAQRSYNDRHHLLAAVEPDVHLTASGAEVYRWTSAGLATVESGIRAYFHQRQEDEHLVVEEPAA